MMKELKTWKNHNQAYLSFSGKPNTKNLWTSLQEMMRCMENVVLILRCSHRNNTNGLEMAAIDHFWHEVSLGFVSKKLELMWLWCLKLHLWIRSRGLPLLSCTNFGSVVVTRSLPKVHINILNMLLYRASNRHRLDWWSAEVRRDDFSWQPSFSFLFLAPEAHIFFFISFFPFPLQTDSQIWASELMFLMCLHSWDVEIMKRNDWWLMVCRWCWSLFYFEVPERSKSRAFLSEIWKMTCNNILFLWAFTQIYNQKYGKLRLHRARILTPNEISFDRNT